MPLNYKIRPEKTRILAYLTQCATSENSLHSFVEGWKGNQFVLVRILEVKFGDNPSVTIYNNQYFPHNWGEEIIRKGLN